MTLSPASQRRHRVLDRAPCRLRRARGLVDVPRRGLGRGHRGGRDRPRRRMGGRAPPDLMDLSTWSEDARLICRRERPHPGAQLSLFDTSGGPSGTRVSSRTRMPLSIGRRCTRASPTRPCPRRGQGPVLERLRAAEPAVRELHPEPRLGGHPVSSPGRCSPGAQMTCLDGELKKAEPKTLPLPAVARRRRPRAPWAPAHLATGRDLAVGSSAQASIFSGCGTAFP